MIDAVLTIVPPPCCAIWISSYFMHSHTPVRYDNDSRRQTVTLPNGVTVTYGYDPDFHVTSITYKTGIGATIGTLNYGYDADGCRVSVGGSLAQTNLPLAQSFSYNPDNSLETLGSITVQNDNDGNITCMSTTCPQFSYDARGNLYQAVPNGVALGPQLRRCGTAAFARQRVIDRP